MPERQALSLEAVPVMVTGGAGFIGSHLVDRLLELDARVTVLDNFTTGKTTNLEHCVDRITLIEGDVRELDTCRRAIAGQRFVFHQAALGSVPRSVEDPSTSLSVNAQGTANVLTATCDQGVERIVFASSSSVYGDSDELPKREGREGRPLSPYAASKWIAEEMAEVFHRTYGLETVGLRYFNIYGPRQDPDGPYAAVVPRFFKSYLTGEPPTIHGDGEQSRDFTHVADAVDANLLALSCSAAGCGRAYNIAAGARITVKELAAAIGALADSRLEPTHDEPRPGDVRHSLADLSLAEKALGFRPSRSLEEGLATCLDYYHDLYSVEPAP